MSQPEPLTELNDENIIQFCPNSTADGSPEMMKLVRLQSVIKSILRSSEVNDAIALGLQREDIETYTWSRGHYWLRDGVGCEVLKLGDAQWRSGRIRMQVTLEFVPDETDAGQKLQEHYDESPLAEIRQEITSQGLNV